MANSRYDFHKEEEQLTELRFNFRTYIIVRLDGDKFHKFSAEHNFHKPNDKRALDLMAEAAKQVLRTYKGHIPLAYGHSDEFSFLIKSTSRLLSRRRDKITSMLTSVFSVAYNSNWDKFFGEASNGQPTPRKYDAWFDAKPREYANYESVIDYFRWRQVDCHINNLYNTTLHALTGRYIKHELLPDNKIKRTPIRDWVDSQILSSSQATDKLTGTRSTDKHEILFHQYKINYNNELEQFKKGTVVLDTQTDYNGKNADPDAIRQITVNFLEDPEKVKANFWDEHKHIFDDYVNCPRLK